VIRCHIKVKDFEDMFTRFDTLHERDGRIDRATGRSTNSLTDRQHNPRYVSDKLHFGDKQNSRTVKPQIQKFSVLS